jgi:hypothetical protein
MHPLKTRAILPRPERRGLPRSMGQRGAQTHDRVVSAGLYMLSQSLLLESEDTGETRPGIPGEFPYIHAEAGAAMASSNVTRCLRR